MGSAEYHSVVQPNPKKSPILSRLWLRRAPPPLRAPSTSSMAGPCRPREVLANGSARWNDRLPFLATPCGSSMQEFPLERGRNLICPGVLADDSNVLPVV